MTLQEVLLLFDDGLKVAFPGKITAAAAGFLLPVLCILPASRLEPVTI